MYPPQQPAGSLGGSSGRPSSARPSFLGTAAAAGVGALGGMLVGDMISHAFTSHDSGGWGSGWGGGWNDGSYGAQDVTVIDNSTTIVEEDAGPVLWEGDGVFASGDDGADGFW